VQDAHHLFVMDPQKILEREIAPPVREIEEDQKHLGETQKGICDDWEIEASNKTCGTGS
jgi:hypothetical protein